MPDEVGSSPQARGRAREAGWIEPEAFFVADAEATALILVQKSDQL